MQHHCAKKGIGWMDLPVGRYGAPYGANKFAILSSETGPCHSVIDEKFKDFGQNKREEDS